MLANERRQYILQQLKLHKTIYTSDIVNQLHITSETVRKDFNYLEQQNLLKRVHGGAVLVGESGETEIPYMDLEKRDSMNMEEKLSIASYAASLVKDGQTISLDYGSTSFLLAKQLASSMLSLTVITNSIKNTLALMPNPNIEVILLGGKLHKKEYTLVNDLSHNLDYLHADILFMSVSGIDLQYGFSDQSLEEVKVQNELRCASTKTIVVADSSKFQHVSLVRICPVQEAEEIITDNRLDSSVCRQFKDAGVKIERV
jgi:DeoR family fructose operon transcriptional repressor